MSRFKLPHVTALVASILSAWAAAPSHASSSEHNTTWARVSGRAAGIRFEPLTRADGVSTEHFYQVLEDHRGFLWFTTMNGLVRYDGNRQVLYPGMPRSRIPPNTQAVPGLLFEDRQGTMWVASNILTRFDPSTGKFMESINPRPGPPRPGIDFITAVHDGPGNSLWVGVYSRSSDKIQPRDISDPVLYEVKPASGTSVPHPIPASITHGQPVAIRAIEEDARGRVWLGTSIGLIRFDPPTGTFQHYPHTHPDANVRELKHFNTLIRDKTGHLWVHMPAGVERFDPETGTFDRFIAAQFWYMFADPGGRIWMWGEFNGLKVLDPLAPAESALKTVFFTSPSGQSMDEIVLATLGSDRQGNVWAYPSTGSMAYRYSPALAKFGRHVSEKDNPNSLSSGLVLGLSGNPDGTVWVLDNTGLNRFDPTSGNFTRLPHDPRKPNGIADLITSIYQDRSHTFWVGTDDGFMGSFDWKRGRYTPLHGPNMKHTITSMFEDSSGRFWMGARLGPLRLVDRRTGVVTRMDIAGGYVAYEDRARNLWFGAPPGVNKLDRAGNVRTISLREPDAANPAPTVVTSIYEDAGGLLWMASNRGIFQFDPRSEKSVSYGTREGLPTEDVRCMLPDEDGNFWASTAEGISRFDRREHRFYNYGERDGLQSGEFTHFVCYAAHDGRLYFGGHSGLNAFFPREVLARDPQRPVVLTALQINGKEMPLIGTDRIRLEYGQNTLSFEFAVLNPVNPGKFRYRFKLDNLETQWTEVDNEHRIARYTELPPGDYVFRAEGSSDGRSWGSAGAAFRIAILPPWWRTWWAEVLGAILFTGLLLGAYRLRMEVLNRHRRQLEALVEQRTQELVQLRDRERDAREQAQAASRAKSQFLANMSHELRTPLSAILGFSTLLRDSDLTTDQCDKIQAISRSGEHLLGLINDVLDVAKIEAGKEELAIVAGDLSVTMRTAIEMMRVRADDRHLSLVYEQTAEVPPYVRIDAPKLRQILINLLSNAIKFTKEGGVSLRLSATPAKEPGRVQLRFDVEDTGAGIPQQDLARIFQPFEQVRKPGGPAGTGLGLTITRRFVEMMGGSLHVESSVGRGSRFTVELPVELAAESEIGSAELAQAHRFLLEPGQPEYRVLIVEDDPENAAVLRQMLTRAGFPVRVAGNGALGIEVFQEWRPHFIWMDLNMPQLNGMEATGRIRALEGGAKVKIVAITASAFDSDREVVISAGFDDFTFKPFRPAEIFGCMAHHLGVRYSAAPAAHGADAADSAYNWSEAIASLPPESRRRLKDAVTSLNRSQIAAALDEVRARDEVLGDVLRQIAKRLAYTSILDAVERAESRSGHVV